MHFQQMIRVASGNGGCKLQRIVSIMLGVLRYVSAHCRHMHGPVQAKGVGDAGAAAFRVSGLELGGLFGSLLAGRISDYLIAKNPEGGNVGKRVQVVMGYTVGIAAMLATFYLAPASAGWLQWASVFMIGFFLYGPQV